MLTHSPSAAPDVPLGVRGVLRVDADGVRTKRHLALGVERGVDHALSLPPK